jgi:hypothetical protein
MVIVNIYGGLGNQLFQYAAGRAVAHRNKTVLKLDISAFESYSLRKYELGVFNIVAEFASAMEIARLKPKPKSLAGKVEWRIRRYFTRHLVPYYRRSVFAEQSLESFDPNIFKARKDVYLEGYWQSERYFFDIEPIIRREFTLREEPNLANRTMLERIRQVNAVSLHVRRGDYVTNPHTNQFHGVPSLHYYAAAIDLIANQVDHPQFFVFSDDIAWVKENLTLDFPITYVDHNGSENAQEDLRLMSNCRHHIIANSSFSWWGAWLASNSDKVVVAPSAWFAAVTVDPASRYPKEWHVL